MKQELFVVRCYPLAKQAGEQFKMNPLTILAQAAFESDWGTSVGARQRNNFFGITAAGQPNAFWDGAFSIANNQYKLKFRVYKTAQDSFMDFARLISERYKDAHKASHDHEAYAQAIAYSPYISESNGDNRESYRKGIVTLHDKIKAIAEKKGCTKQQP